MYRDGVDLESSSRRGCRMVCGVGGVEFGVASVPVQPVCLFLCGDCWEGAECECGHVVG